MNRSVGVDVDPLVNLQEIAEIERPYQAKLLRDLSCSSSNG